MEFWRQGGWRRTSGGGRGVEIFMGCCRWSIWAENRWPINGNKNGILPAQTRICLNGWKMIKSFLIPIKSFLIMYPVFHIPFLPIFVFIPKTVGTKLGTGTGRDFPILL
jgi:hypothetical protein